MTKNKKLLFVALPLLLIALGVYTVIWYKIAAEIERQVGIAWTDIEAKGAKITAERPKPYGYPFTPMVSFRGSITEGNGRLWTIPEITLRGFFVPGSDVQLLLPAGATLNGPDFPRPIVVQTAGLRAHIPGNMPRAFTQSALKAWQQAGGEIPIREAAFQSDPLRGRGEGALYLDSSLQIAGSLQVRIFGMGDLLADLTERGILQGRSALTAQSFLQLLNQTDPVTGETFFDAPLKIQNRGVFIGPMRVGIIPEIFWADPT